MVKWAAAIEHRRGRAISVVALARKMAGVLWAMWRRQMPYKASYQNNEETAMT